jgi:SAM-dependent methyltransferase
MTDHEAILENARYLREVRPLDPEEIHVYVEGKPQPAVVRQTIRHNAYDLGVREREDGSFVPVGEGPVSRTFRGVERFPAAYAERFADRLVDRYGEDWPEGDAGDRLRARIDRLKEAYFGDEAVEYGPLTADAYGIYHLPDYYAAVQYVLDDLADDGLLARRLRVLDVGAGIGGPALGLQDYLPADSLVDYAAVEPSAAADVLERLLAATRPGFDATVHREAAQDHDPDGPYDLVLFGNVLSELDDPVAVADRYLDAVSDDGTLVALAPAEERTATRLRAVERDLLERRGDATVYAPTVRLWPDAEPADRGWTFRRERDLAVPSFQRRLDAAADGDGTYVNVDVQFAYLLVRTDGRTAVEYEPHPADVARMAAMDDHVTDRIDLVALKLSPNLAEVGNPLFKVSDGSEQVDHYAVLTRESTLNEVLTRAPYGALLRFENVLVLWNDDEAAYNLVVEAETVVDRLA